LQAFYLFRLSVRADPLEAGAWLRTSANTTALGLNLIPFAGIAFLWFIAVLRDRLGELEDRFFATVFLGSGLLFLAMLGDSTLSSTSPAPGLCSKSAGMSAIRHFRRRNTFEAFQSAGQQVVAPGRDKRLTAEYAGTF